MISEEFLEEASCIAVDAAKAAGAVLLQNFRKKLVIEIKDDNPKNLVTNVDKECDVVIQDIIKKRFPEHGIVSEESEPNPKEYTWYVDPLDGTTNFSRGCNFFCTSIALAKGNEVLVAVIYNPIYSELYSAVKGKGAFLNGEKISVEDTSKLIQAVISCEFSYSNELTKKMAALATQLGPLTKSMHINGSGALSMCQVALGVSDCHIDGSSTAWDYAAAALIVREAGGKVTDFTGNEWIPKSKNIVGSNNLLHEAVLDQIRKAYK